MKWLVIACLFAVSSTFANESHSTSAVSFLTHNLKQQVYTDSNGVVRGIAHAGRRAFNLELVREMFKRRGLKFIATEVPFLRGYELVVNGPRYALFNISRNADRESLFKWVGPLQVDTIQFFQNSALLVRVEKFSDLTANIRACVLRGSRHEKILRERTRVILTVTNSYDSCFRILAEGRVDITPVSVHEARTIIKASGVAQEQIRQTPVVLYKSEGYIAFSKQVPDEEILNWQRVLDEIKADGHYDFLKSNYLLSPE